MKEIWFAAAAAVMPATAASAQHQMHGDIAALRTSTLMQGYGTSSFKITTANPKAQP